MFHPNYPRAMILCSSTSEHYLRVLNEDCFLKEIKDVKITTQYRNKGVKEDCNTYRGISLLNVTGKICVGFILSRVQFLAERLYPESQRGFRRNRSTTNMIVPSAAYRLC